MDNYADLKRIGRGNYGTVALARDVRNGRDYCLKQISMEAFTEDERAQAQQEVEVLRSLDHPGIVRYHEHFVCRASQTLCVVMAYCEGGDLSHEIKRRATRNESFDEKQVLDWFVQMVMALRYVHSKRILHRDLKTQNIFIAHHNGRALIKLGDFGIAKVMETKKNSTNKSPSHSRLARTSTTKGTEENADAECSKCGQLWVHPAL